MADTKALRLALERQISELQRKLRAVEEVELLGRELLVPEPTRRISTKPSEAEHDVPGPRSLGESTVIEAVERSLGPAWQDVSFYFDAVLKEIPDARKAAVSTALARLTEKNVAESKKRGSRREGYLYRKHP